MATEQPPKPGEVQRSLFEIRFPLEVYLGELQAQRDRILRQQPTPVSEDDADATAGAAQIRTRIRDQQRIIDTFPTKVYRTLVLWNSSADTFRMHALIPNDCEPPQAFSIRGWIVEAIHLSSRMQRCQVGDLLPGGLVVSVNGGPILAGPGRARAMEEAKISRMTAREQRKLERERRKKNAERFHFEREKREEEMQKRITATIQAKDPEPPRAFDHAQLRPATAAGPAVSYDPPAPAASASTTKVAPAGEDEIAAADGSATADSEESGEDQSGILVAEIVPAPSEALIPVAARQRTLRPAVPILMVAFCIGCAIGYATAREYFSLFGLVAVALAWTCTAIVPQRTA